MGIRFLCPNGHKLNVKAELAGKRGSCPECGAKLMIPAASPAPKQLPATAVVVEDPSLGTSPTGLAWHLRSATGEQLGPVSELQFRAWIAAGRVTADSLVWREGWPAWKLARDAADLLPTPLMATPIAIAPAASPLLPSDLPVANQIGPVEPAVAANVGPLDGSAVVEPGNIQSDDIEPVITDAINTDPAPLPASVYVYQRSRNKQKQITLAIAMLVAVVVLAGVLYWVVVLNSTPDGEATLAPATTSTLPLHSSAQPTAIA